MEKYTKVKEIGKGSFGTAFLCERKGDGRKCVIKEISLQKMAAKEVNRTLQESDLLGKMRHPNIVALYESFVDNRSQKLAIVMEYANGGDLEGYLKARHGRLLSESETLSMFVQMCLGLKHIHDRKILHRDLKCQNIFLTSSGIVKIGDFGIAKVLKNTRELAATRIGTPYYMSPVYKQITLWSKSI
jgi:NIMA (never in mitosis gene a)-related kinase